MRNRFSWYGLLRFDVWCVSMGCYALFEQLHVSELVLVESTVVTIDRTGRHYFFSLQVGCGLPYGWRLYHVRYRVSHGFGVRYMIEYQ